MQQESVEQKVSRLKNEFLANVESGQIKSYGKNPYGFDIVLKAGTKLVLKADPKVTAIAVEDCCITCRIKYTSDCESRRMKKGDVETMYSYTMFNNFNIK